MRNTHYHKIKKRLIDASKGGKLLLAVSGGADSTLLLAISAQAGVPCIVVHCNFQLRGEESNRDERFVSDLCKRYGLPLKISRFNTRAYCKEHKVSIETGCRELRYDLFRTICDRENCSRIVTAHNADDNVETFILNLMRGAGIEGLTGMCTDNGSILRPMIDVWRSDILAILAEMELPHIEDSTNGCSDYRRNFVRNEVLPLLESRWPAARRTILRAQENIRNDAELISTLTEDGNILTWDDMGLNNGGHRQPHSIIFRYARSHGLGRSRALEMTKAALNRSLGRKWHTPQGYICLEHKGFVHYSFLNGDCPAQFDSLSMNFKHEEIELTPEIWNEIKGNSTHDTVWLPGTMEDYKFRSPKPGEHIAPLGIKGSKRISLILKDAKLSSLRRSEYLILARIGDDVPVWMPGLKRSRHALLSPTDKKALKITLTLEQQ